MLFDQQVSLVSNAPGMKVQKKTSPNAVVFGNALFVFYSGSTDEGIWYTSTTDAMGWNSTTAIKNKITGMGVQEGSSPNAVVFKNTLYLFYTGIGEDGIWYTTTRNGQSWSSVQSIQKKTSEMNVLEGTSASAVVLGNTLYLFYSGNTDEGIWYTSTTDGVAWRPLQAIKNKISGMGVQEGSSPNAVVLGNTLYLFYTGIGGDGIWYTTTTNGQSWTPVKSIKKQASGMGVMKGTSASALAYSGRLYLFYTGSGEDGLWYTTSLDGTTWSKVRSMRQDMTSGSQGVMKRTSAWVVEFDNLPYVFWNGAGADGIWFSREAVFGIEAQSETIFDQIRASQEFVVSVNDPRVVAFVNHCLGSVQRYVPAPLGDTDVGSTALSFDFPSAVAVSGQGGQGRRVLSATAIAAAVVAMGMLSVVAYAISKGYVVSGAIQIPLARFNYTFDPPQMVVNGNALPRHGDL